MDIVHLLPSFPQFLRFALSLFNSLVVMFRRKTICETLTMTAFDISPETGFFPPRPLPKLEEPFDIWETALAEAPEILSLGDDETEAAVERQNEGNAWRERVKSVREL
jgi:indoleamine 2,3-dioxygenase